MSKKVVFVPNGENIYAVPTDVCEKYELSGDDLTAAKNAMEDTGGDVEGQEFTNYSLGWKNSRGEAWSYDGSGNIVRAHWLD